MSGSAGGIGDYYGEQLAGYYGDGGPTAFWFGDGAEILDLRGVPSKSQIRALMDAKHPGTGAKLGMAFRKSDKAPSARGYDLTLTVPKDISVLWALTNAEARSEIETAVNASAVAVLERLDKNPPIRVKGEIVAGAGIAAAVIPEHTSRAGDPSLHVHCLISSKVQHPETGGWYALDARELKQHQQAYAAMFHRALEAELTSRLGLGWGPRNPDSRGFTTPLAGANTKVCEALSARTVAVKERLEVKLARFRADLDREPTPQERYALEREAAVDSRPEKTEINETEARHEWRAVAAEETGAGTSYTEALAPHHTTPIPLTNELMNMVIAAAIGELEETRSIWRRGHLVTEIARHMPTGLDVTASALVRLVDDAADRVLAGRRMVPVSVSANSHVPAAGMVDPMATYTTAEVLAEEIGVATWFEQALSGDAKIPTDIETFADRELSEGQTKAAARAAGTGRVELIVGPAGTGKTTALKAAVSSLKAQGRAVYGLAPSASASTQLATAGCETENVTKFLYEHASNRGPSPQFQLPAGATVIVDEAGMVSTRQWAQLTKLAEEKGWRIVAVGDGFQFSAVGRGGMFDMLCRTTSAEDRVSRLEKVHRFRELWEADASLQLRHGNSDIVDAYVENRRVFHSPTDKTAINLAADAWIERLGHDDDIGLFASSNKTVTAINTAIQKRLINNETVTDVIKLGTGSTAKRFGVGDVVVTRQNNRDLVTDLGHWVRNRDRWAVVSHDIKKQTITLKGQYGTVTIDAAYAKESLELGYAQTSHASQGRTVDKSILVIGTEDIVDRAAIYVPLTRGRETNIAIVAGAHNQTEATDRITAGIGNRWIDSPAISHITTGSTLAEMIVAAEKRFAETENVHKQAQRHRDKARRLHNNAVDRWAKPLIQAQQAATAAQHALDNHRRPRIVTKKWERRHAELAAVVDETRIELAAVETKRETKVAPLARTVDLTVTITQKAATALAAAGQALHQLQQTRQQQASQPVSETGAGKEQPDPGIGM